MMLYTDCSACPVWQAERDKLLKDCNSVFEAVNLLEFFEKSCQEKCKINTEI